MAVVLDSTAIIAGLISAYRYDVLVFEYCDKKVIVQLIVSTDGFAGICYCHSPAEGPAVAALMDYACDEMNKKHNTGVLLLFARA